jgi:MtN3 and saliva related transmembrane protein
VTLALGLIAATLTIASFLAQTGKIIKTRDTKALATPTWVMSTVAFALWVAYGLVLGEWPIVIPNAICFVLAAFILALKLMPRRKRDGVIDKLSSLRT